MKKLLLLVLLPIVISCNGQTYNANETYSARKEYGLKGNVKEQKKYVCKVEKNQLPIDTANFSRRYINIFDENGNALEDKALIKNPANTLQIQRTYSGKGKEISCKETYAFDNQEVVENEQQYVWLDDFSYKITDENDEQLVNIIKLNSSYNIVETYLKQADTETTENIETIFKEDKIQKTVSVMTIKKDDQTNKSYHIEVVKNYDKMGNPTVIYVYDTPEEKQAIAVVFKTYQYY